MILFHDSFYDPFMILHLVIQYSFKTCLGFHFLSFGIFFSFINRLDHANFFTFRFHQLPAGPIPSISHPSLISLMTLVMYWLHSRQQELFLSRRNPLWIPQTSATTDLYRFPLGIVESHGLWEETVKQAVCDSRMFSTFCQMAGG